MNKIAVNAVLILAILFFTVPIKAYCFNFNYRKPYSSSAVIKIIKRFAKKDKNWAIKLIIKQKSFKTIKNNLPY